jgi:hypothetical protein
LLVAIYAPFAPNIGHQIGIAGNSRSGLTQWVRISGVPLQED